MSRAIGANLGANLDGSNLRPQWLLRLGSLRYCSAGDADGNDVTWSAHTWVRAGFEVSPFDDHAIVPSLVVTFMTNSVLRSALAALASSAAVELYSTASLSTFSTNDVVPIFSGTLGGGRQVSRDSYAFGVGNYDVWPSTVAGPNSGLTEVSTPGRYPIGMGGVVVILERGF